jgi:hypothetical protein
MFLGPKALVSKMLGMIFCDITNQKKTKLAKKAMDLASNIANTSRLTMLHNNVFEKFYNY